MHVRGAGEAKGWALYEKNRWIFYGSHFFARFKSDLKKNSIILIFRLQFVYI